MEAGNTLPASDSKRALAGNCTMPATGSYQAPPAMGWWAVARMRGS